MQIGDLMRREVRSLASSATFSEAAAMLREHGISSVVVLDDGRLSGIVTERDLVNLIAAGGDPKTTQLSHGMSSELDTIDPRTDVLEAAGLMGRRKIRHLPVVQEGSVVGIVSIRDLTDWAIRELTTGHELPDIERSHAALAAAAELGRG